MTTADAPATTTGPDLDAAITELKTGSRAWSALTLTQRRVLFQRVRAAVARHAEEWAETAARSKGLGADHPLRGEEWLSGPYAVLSALDAYCATLDSLARGESPVHATRLSAGPGDRTVVRAFPSAPLDHVVLSGFSADVWLTPGTTPGQARAAAGPAQLDPTTPGGVGVVLGAGNITSIPVLDVLYELLAFNRVVVLKLNPTQDALRPVFDAALAPLIEGSYLRIVQGAGDVGAALTTRDDIDHVHITGSEATFRTIVWGREPGETPQLTVPITAELGGVAPIIVVPGKWSDADLRFHAEHVATMRLQNAGNNCIAGQMVVISSDWPQRDAFLGELRRAYASAPGRPTWYPGVDAKLQSARDAYPRADWSASGTRALIEVTSEDAHDIEDTEYFGPILGIKSLPGRGQEFLDAAVTYANDELLGTLGANVLIDPATHSALGRGFDRAIERLHYGTVAINAWTALGFLIPTATWGAYPGGTLESAPSGIGIVHNAYLLSDVERTVVTGPFRPFPRSLGRSRFSLLPKPPWFVTSRTGAAVSEGLTKFLATHRPTVLLRALVKAFVS